MRRVAALAIALTIWAHADVGAQATRPRTFKPLGPAKTVVAASRDAVLQPTLIRASGDRVIVFDYGDGALKAFSIRTGEVLWKTGRFGGGPGEFANPTAIAIAKDSSIWVNDPEQVRVTVYTRDGKLRRGFKPSEPFEHIVLLDNGRFIGAELRDAKQFAAVFDSIGTKLSTILPPITVARLDPLARSYFADGDEAWWFVAPGFTGQIMRFKTDVRGFTELESREVRPALRDTVFSPKPGWVVRKPNPRAVHAIHDIAYNDGMLYVLGGAEGKTPGRIIDVYDAASAAYRYSFALPDFAGSFDVTRNGIVTLQAVDEVPTIMFYDFAGAR